MSDLKTISARIPSEYNVMIEEIAKEGGISKSDVIRNAIIGLRTQDVVLHKLKADGGSVEANPLNTWLDEEDERVLISAGVGIAGGVVGYKLTKWIRETYTEEEDEYWDVIGGLAVGLLGALLTYTQMSRK